MMIGHTWTVPASVRPAVMSAACGPHAYGMRSRKITHPGWVLDYTFEPPGRVRVARGPWFERRPATGHLYPPFTPYWEDTRPVRGRLTSAHIIFLANDAAFLEPLGLAVEGFARFEDNTGILADELKRVATVGQDLGERGFFRAQSGFYRILHLLLNARRIEDNRFDVREEPVMPGSPLVRGIQAFMKRHLSSRLTLQEIAREAHVSGSTLSHSYKAETGESPMATLMGYRIGAAKNLLLKGHRLQAIADQTAFSDAFHLSKAFKKVEGCSPREYLRRLNS